MGLIETAARRVLSEELTGLQDKTRQYDQGMELLLERFAALELALEDSGWRRLSAEGEREFSRKGLQQIIALSRLMYLSNPLINRAVDLQSLYVWGQGVTMSSEDEATADLISQTTTHRQNKVELFGHQGRKLKEIELQVTGNVFLALFRNISNGTLEISSIPVEEIDEIIRDPENRAQVWYYKRVWTAQEFDQSGRLIGTHKTAYYPDWTYQPHAKPQTIGTASVMWDSPIYHIKVGGFSDMAFGVPETYAAIDWARAYKEFLEDWASIVRAHKRFAWQMKVGGGKAGIAAAKSKLNSTLSTDSYETNPAPTVGSTYIASGENKIEPIKTAGATVSAEDGRRLLLMVCTATGIPECYASDTEVLTESGFMRHDQWQPGTRIAAYDPETGLTHWEHPEGRAEHYYNGPMVHFHNRQTDILVTPNHRMWAAPEVQWELMPATGVLATAAYGQGQRGHRLRVNDGAPANVDRSWRITHAADIVASPRSAGWKFSSDVRFDQSDGDVAADLIDTPIGVVDAEAWARFIGYFVSEGSTPQSVCKSGEYRKDGTPIMRTFRRISLSQRDGEVLEGMRRTLRSLGLHFGETTVNAGVKNLTIWNKPLWLWLREHCGEGSATKRIPAELLAAAEPVRRALYDALMAGDGGRSGGSWRYSSASPELADQMQLLAIGLGYGASVSPEHRLYRGTKRPIYRVWIRTRVTTVSRIRPQHVSLEGYTGLVYCFQVSTGIYVTRRNGCIAVQGNTFFGDVSLGTLATAKSLDRPTELKYRDRQLLWTDVYQDLLAYARDAKTLAPNSGLVIETDATIDVEFPPVIQGDIEAQLKAIVSAATLDGKPLAGTMDIRTAARLVLTALGQDDIEELISNLPEPGEPGGEVSDDEMVEALRNLNEAVKGLAAD